MFGFTVNSIRKDFNEVVTRVTEELQKEGFGVLTDIDVQATLKKKLDVDKRAYRILGACNPGLANQVIDIEPDAGLLLPCNVVVREDEDGSVSVLLLDPGIMAKMIDRSAIGAVAKEARTRLERVRDALAHMQH